MTFSFFSSAGLMVSPIPRFLLFWSVQSTELDSIQLLSLHLMYSRFDSALFAAVCRCFFHSVSLREGLSVEFQGWKLDLQTVLYLELKVKLKLISFPFHLLFSSGKQTDRIWSSINILIMALAQLSLPAPVSFFINFFFFSCFYSFFYISRENSTCRHAQKYFVSCLVT